MAINRELQPGVYLAYASHRSEDGLGAQTQRLMGIFAAATTLGFGYIHNPIQFIEQNPGDPHSSLEARRDYLERVNRLFALPSSSNVAPRWRVSIRNLSQKNVHRLLWLNRISRASRRAIQVDLQLPLPWSDFHPDSYQLSSAVISPRLQPRTSSDNSRIDLHIRRALAPKTGRDGSPYDRYVPTEWFVMIAKTVARTMRSRGLHPRFRVHTDIPSNRWQVPSDTSSGTLGMWRHHRLVDEEGYLVDLSENLVEKFESLGNVEIAREWDPLDAIESMATSSILVTYASSMSYVAGLLRGNNPTISPKFFHATPSTWFEVPTDLAVVKSVETRTKLEEFVGSRLAG